MKKTRTTYDEAIGIYATFYGMAPTVKEITDLWHRYANEWKHFNGFTDWLTYNG